MDSITLSGDYVLLVLVASGCFILGSVITLLIYQIKNRNIEQIHDLEKQRYQDLIQSMEKTFMALSGEALRKNNQTFIQLAEQTLQRYQSMAKSELNSKEKSFENMIIPIKDSLKNTEGLIQKMEIERKESQSALSSHLTSLISTQQALHSETRNLVQALRRPEVRGQWGELTLKRLIELAGMVEHCDFVEQSSVESDQGLLRPDMIVHMPGGRDVVVDVKTPLDAYLSAVESTDEQTQNKFLHHHTLKVKQRIRELAAKTYWQQFKSAPDFIILFIPGDQFLNAALNVDHNLIETALTQKVILATPTSLVALLRAIAYGWRQETLASNADKIRILGQDLYNRLMTMTDHFSKLGKNIDASVTLYNKTIGSFESMVIPAARKFIEMGVDEQKKPSELPVIEKRSRPLKRS